MCADGKLILLDEDGVLSLATVSSEKLTIVSKVQLLANRSWTAPALIGTKLFMRDRARIMAVSLD